MHCARESPHKGRCACGCVQREWEVLGWVGGVKINSDISLLPVDDKWWHICHCSGIVSVYILILHQTDKCYWWSTQDSDERFILLVLTCNYTREGGWVAVLWRPACEEWITIPPLNLITPHTCGNAVGLVKREGETEWTVNKLAFKQDNLGLSWAPSKTRPWKTDTNL